MTQEQLPTSIKEIMDGMPGAFQPDKAAGANAVIQFNFTGDEPGNYLLRLTGAAAQPSTFGELHEYLRAEGRDPSTFGIEGRISGGRPEAERQVERAVQWRDLGASHLSVNTMGAGLAPRDHVAALRRFKEAWDAAERGDAS